MLQSIWSQMKRAFGDAMFASVDGAEPRYMALAPHILAPRHVSPPSILGNNMSPPAQRTTGCGFQADTLSSMDGCKPEYLAKSPSTLR